MRVYTFTMPKFVSGFVRKCMVVFQKDDQPKAIASNNKNKKRKKKKRQAEVIQPGVLFLSTISALGADSLITVLLYTLNFT